MYHDKKEWAYVDISSLFKLLVWSYYQCLISNTDWEFDCLFNYGFVFN
jgi:hypothetical protein